MTSRLFPGSPVIRADNARVEIPVLSSSHPWLHRCLLYVGLPTDYFCKPTSHAYATNESGERSLLGECAASECTSDGDCGTDETCVELALNLAACVPACTYGFNGDTYEDTCERKMGSPRLSPAWSQPRAGLFTSGASAGPTTGQAGCDSIVPVCAWQYLREFICRELCEITSSPLAPMATVAPRSTARHLLSLSPHLILLPQNQENHPMSESLSLWPQGFEDLITEKLAAFRTALEKPSHSLMPTKPFGTAISSKHITHSWKWLDATTPTTLRAPHG